MPISLLDRANAAFAGSCLSLRLRAWKIFAPFAFSKDVRRDSLDPCPSTVDFCESVDSRDLAAGVAVDSPSIGDDVDVLGAMVLSVLLVNDLLLRGRWALDNASMCSYTEEEWVS